MTGPFAHRRWGIILTAIITVSLAGCASAPESVSDNGAFDSAALTEDSQQAKEPDFDFSDPRDLFEDFNCAFWDFNRDTLDPYILLPMANTYEKVPSFFRQGVYNFTDNLSEPVNFINNVLQLKMGDAATNVGRFVMNTSLGFLGFFDVASSVGLTEQKESFGETLATYGVPQGPYFMLPAAGPTVLIDRGGDVVDSILWPNLIYGWQITAAKYLLRGLSQRIELKQLEPMLENSIDEYTFVREAYFSYWLDKVYDGNAPAETLWDDPWDDDWESEWKDEWNNKGAANQNTYNPSATVEFNLVSWQRVKQQSAAQH